MDLATYQELAKRTATHPDPNTDMYELMALGLIGETGEVVDLIKKHKYHGVPMDVEKLKKEVGDCLWYLANGLTLCDLTFDDPWHGVKLKEYHLGVDASSIAASLIEERFVFNGDKRDYLDTLSALCTKHGFTLEDAAECNIEKLKRRYPDGFDLDRAANHDSE